MLDILLKWNKWGSANLEPGIIRSETAKIIAQVDNKDITILMGPRRSGKSTILYQTINYLEQQPDIDPKQILHLNFEEPLLDSQLGDKILDRVYDTYRSEVNPKGKAYLFLDEIQNVPNWEKWARARNQTEDIKLFLTGSSSKLMSRELASVLTGRYLGFYIYPLDFKEFLHFNDIELPEKPWGISPPPVIKKAFLDYLRIGGYPEVVLSQDPERQDRLLLQYFDDTLFKDISLRHNIRDVQTLRNIAIHLFGQSASLLSYKKIANQFGVSADLAQTYCNYISECFLVDFLQHFSLKASIRNRNPKKVHAIDVGMRNRLAITGSQDRGRLLESIVFNKLMATARSNIYYWRKDQEIDFVVHEGNQVQQLIQVMYGGLDDTKSLQRELKALAEARQEFPSATAELYVFDIPTDFSVEAIDSEITIKSIWRWLLD